jgi:hypothetical protein
MATINPENLRKEVLSSNLDEIVARALFEGVPIIFNGDSELYRKWRTDLANLLVVDPCEVVIVGSAAVGVSLSPYKNFKPFGASSDVDVAIISEKFFSEAWYSLRKIDFALIRITPAQRAAIQEHQMNYVYWGCVATDKLLPILPFSISWLTARTKMSEHAGTFGRDINFRIYRDFGALRGYHRLGLRRLRASLME